MKRVISVLLILFLLFVAACSNNDPSQSEIAQEPNDYSDAVQEEVKEVEEVRPLRPITIEGTLPSGTAYADLEPFVNEFFRENEHLLAAFSVSVFVDDYIILDSYFGFVGGTAPDFEILNAPGAVFHWAGATKSLVYVSAMQLYERGLLDLNADIRNYLPNGMITIHEDSDPVTMLHLMNQTSGLMTDRTVDSGQFLWSDETTDSFDLGNYLMRLGLHQPWAGEMWMPNYIATALAGHIVETISGVSFHEYVNTNIFEPLV